MSTETETPTPDLKARVLAAAASTPAPARARLRVRNVAIAAVAAVAVAETFAWWGGLRAAPRPTALVVETALGAACITSVAAWAAFGQGRSMLGRSAVVLGMVSLITPATLFAWKVFWSAQTPEMIEIWPDRPGYKCLRLSLSMAIWPLLAMVLMRRNSDPNHPRLTGASLGIAASACAWVFTDLWCPVAYVPHLLLGHVLPMILLAGAGALLGNWLIALRPRP